jgi:peptidoglycan/LPS O-acetylase OafA/YrhL
VAEEQVTAPDQHKPTSVRLARVTGIVTIIALLLMTSPFNNHTGWMEDAFLVGTAALIAIFLGVDALLRRNGLRR